MSQWNLFCTFSWIAWLNCSPFVTNFWLSGIPVVSKFLDSFPRELKVISHLLSYRLIIAPLTLHYGGECPCLMVGNVSCEHSIWGQWWGPNSKSSLLKYLKKDVTAFLRLFLKWMLLAPCGCLHLFPLFLTLSSCNDFFYFYLLPILSIIIFFICNTQFYLDQGPYMKKQCWWMACHVLPLS